MLKTLKRLLLFSTILLCSFTVKSDDDGILKTVVIDAGHGGKDPGARGKISREKDIVLDLAVALATKIKAEMPEVKVILTRNSDRFVELSDRSGIANRKKADLFISIHCNASPKSKAVHGTETFAMGLHKTDENLEVAKRENAVILQEKDYKEKYQGFNLNSPLAYIMMANRQSAHLSSSLSFANRVERQFKKYANRSSRGVKQAGFLVLWQTNMPSVLIEAGFLSNEEEEEYLNTEEGQEEISEAIFRAFKQYKKEVEENN
ncbi:MAG: N-acetylmuramoyl-L-alanine amidase [Runella slithyformis]|nr:MAG: N-acetylmuramoyl-L-alanine amidase [Runella slithyformis]TAF00931.1 MAG: N-acetylmuramoyl-L-alanine amidase [Runella slithyformis]TAF29311.1 MAG: N-acetylmuramoyl-L-alanine amidase [Runella slithyformis]TAF48328.1 MAG: N-acetylmuramoyl-L-alanine amidase [Runella slithyformis]TAF83214.1 MAG: N-acetylmuramoyl-L-alanine amidase [Runella slithyformis]